MSDHGKTSEGAFWMLFSALLFGYFGWTMSGTNSEGEVYFLFALLTWTLRVSSILFGLSGILCFVAARPAQLLYAFSGIGSSLALCAVIVMDLIDTSARAAISPFILGLFVALNLYSSIGGLRAVLATPSAAR
ncbi:MAG: hypothetical protein ACYTF9_09325 [Planctomycetota bacterium]|jgi:hypothetical protein